MTTKMFNDFFDLFFPRTCRCCGSTLLSSENQVCINCLLHLSLTNFVDLVNNPVEKIFWGRCKIEAATALFYFRKKGNIQKILHEIKYKSNIKLAHQMGNLLGIDLKKSNRFADVDIIIPVPLHPKKMRKRGYNQSEEIAKGMVEYFPKVINTSCLVRKVDNKTQTRKGRIERWNNVADIFSVVDTESLKGKHILLVDDVLTTGSTLEACASKLIALEGVRVSVATLSSVVE